MRKLRATTTTTSWTLFHESCSAAAQPSHTTLYFLSGGWSEAIKHHLQGMTEHWTATIINRPINLTFSVMGRHLCSSCYKQKLQVFSVCSKNCQSLYNKTKQPVLHSVTTLCLQNKCNKKGLAQQRCSVSAAACGWIQCTNYIYKHLDKQLITPLCISHHSTNQWAALIYCRVRTVSFHLVARCVASCTATENVILVAS